MLPPTVALRAFFLTSELPNRFGCFRLSYRQTSDYLASDYSGYFGCCSAAYFYSCFFVSACTFFDSLRSSTDHTF